MSTWTAKSPGSLGTPTSPLDNGSYCSLWVMTWLTMCESSSWLIKLPTLQHNRRSSGGNPCRAKSRLSQCLESLLVCEVLHVKKINPFSLSFPPKVRKLLVEFSAVHKAIKDGWCKLQNIKDDNNILTNLMSHFVCVFISKVETEQKSRRG